MEVSQPHRRIPVTEPSQPSAARFAAHEAAEAAGFSEKDVYRAGLVATELATNLVKHAAHGEVLVRIESRAPRAEIEIIAIDRGPGIADLPRSLSDGHSTAGTPGTGLGAAKRLSEDFDIHSERNRGTVVLARLRAGRAPGVPSRLLEFSGLALAKPGETICGDAWQIHHHADGALALMADGLGHGVQAGEASGAAIAAVGTQSKKNLSELLETMHAGLRHTRGAAAAIAEIRPGPRLVKFAGIGNISATISMVGSVRHAVSLNGTLGHQARLFREYSYPWERDALLVMHSDGLGSRWSLDDYRGLRQRHPAVVAAVLYRDFRRERDDVAIIVGREPV